MFFLPLAPVRGALLPALALPLHHVLCFFPTHEQLPPLSPCTLQPFLCTEGGESRDNTSWKKELCGEGKEQSECGEFIEPYIQEESNSSRGMMYGGNGTVITKAVTSTKRLIATSIFPYEMLFFFFSNKQTKQLFWRIFSLQKQMLQYWNFPWERYSSICSILNRARK